MKTVYRLYYIMRNFNWQMTRKNISAFASSTSFFLFLSMIPLLMALCAILPYTRLTEENLLTAITKFTPDAMHGLVVSVVSDVYARSAGTITIFAIVTIWSDTSLAFSIAYVEMFTTAKAIAASQKSMAPLVAAGIFYYIFNFVVAFLMELWEKKLGYYS